MNHTITSKQLTFLFLLNICGFFAFAQPVAVTFQVDMSGEDVSSDGVHIAGNFQLVAGLGNDWNPGSTPLSDTDGDGVYDITVDIPPGTYEYKFINGNAWGMDENPPAECSVGSTNNRRVSIGNTDFVLPTVPFDACLATIRFSVNMSGQTVSPEGVHLMGNFQEVAGFGQNWEATSIRLEDINGDDTYDIHLTLPAGNYEYLFVNGDEATAAETLSLDCSTSGDNGTNNRSLVVSMDTPDLPTYCFGTCEECDPYLDTDFDTYWWNDAVFYEIFVRSFYDSDGDGIGDFQGIIEKLDYLNDGDPATDTDLGVTAIWLMPMMESPTYHGYDVTDYYTIEPDYGTMADFEAFLQEAHDRGIRVIIDLVLNHTSSQHPWFTQSVNDANGFRDWYIWSDSNPGFSGPWGQSVWHANGSEYYYGLFWGGMPDLNYNHPPVRDEMFNVASFWLEKGVDGFRLDAIKYLIEDGSMLENTPATFALLEDFGEVYDAGNPDAFTIGEVWSSTASIIPYVQNDRLDVCFEFDLAGAMINAVNDGNPSGIQQQMQSIQFSYPALQYGTFLTNHDMDRVYNQIGLNAEKMKLAASIYLTLPGTPFLYYGEEVGMIGTGPHENIRRPMQWSDDVYAGFSTTLPWNSIGPNYAANNVAVMAANTSSLLNHYKKLIHIRNEQTVLRQGNYLSVSSAASQVLSFARTHEDNAVIVVSNLGTQTVDLSLTLPASGLSPGVYYVTDLYNDQAMGTLTINENGGFDGWSISTTGLGSRETKILSLSVDNPVSTLDRKPAALSFLLYPNPARRVVNIHNETGVSQRGVVTVISANGIPMYESVMDGASLTIPTHDWAKGVYFVRILADGTMTTKQLVIL